MCFVGIDYIRKRDETAARGADKLVTARRCAGSHATRRISM